MGPCLRAFGIRTLERIFSFIRTGRYGIRPRWWIHSHRSSHMRGAVLMKECPRCHAKTFDDMEVCYGCLHRFEPAMAEARDATQLDAVDYPPPGFVGVLPPGSVVTQCSNRPVPADSKACCGLVGAGNMRTGRDGRPVDLSALADIDELELEDIDPAVQPDPSFCLCVDDGRGQVMRHRFDSAHPLVVGRSATCDVELTDPTVSRRHLRVDVDGGNVVIEDLGSSNHTYVDGRRLDGKAVLALGALITIAKAKLWAEQAATPMR